MQAPLTKHATDNSNTNSQTTVTQCPDSKENASADAKVKPNERKVCFLAVESELGVPGVHALAQALAKNGVSVLACEEERDGPDSDGDSVLSDENSEVAEME